MDENWKELFTAIGRLEKGQEGLTDHVRAVSNKVDIRFKESMDETREVRKVLESHSRDENAHGAGGERRGRGMVSSAIIGALSAAAAAFGIMRVLGVSR